MPTPKLVARVRWTVAVALLLLAAGCGDGGAPDRPPTPSPSRSVSPSAEASPNGGLLVWADAPLVPVIQRLGQAAGFDLTVEEVSAEAVPAQLAASPTPGRAPDVVVLAHDSLGPLVEQGVLAPLDPPAGSDAFLPVATSAFSLGGHLYGLPFAVENVALIRNIELVPEPPATFEEVERVALQLQGQGKVDVPFGLPVPDPYHEYPLFTALGGYVFGRNLDGTYDPQDLGLDGPQSLHAAEEFGRWRADGLIDPEVTVDVMIHAFTSGATPFAVTGPWVVLDPTQGFEASGVSFSVDPLPSVEGAAPRPLVRALGFAVPSSAADPEKAISFVLEVFTAPAAQAELAGAVDRPPAMTAALEGSSIDERLRGFGLAARDGDPLPAIPEMTEVWGPWADAYAKIFQQTAPPEQAFRDAAEAIRSAISGGVSPSPAPGD